MPFIVAFDAQNAASNPIAGLRPSPSNFPLLVDRCSVDEFVNGFRFVTKRSTESLDRVANEFRSLCDQPSPRVFAAFYDSPVANDLKLAAAFV